MVAFDFLSNVLVYKNEPFSKKSPTKRSEA